MNVLPAIDSIQCYWVLPGRFLAGEYPAHMDRPRAVERLDALLGAGIDSFFDLTEMEELEPYVPLLRERAALQGRLVHYQRFPIQDFGVPTAKDMQALQQAIDSALESGHNIYAHCWGGVGRTGMTVGCYLVRHGRTGDEAIQQIAAWRRSLPVFAFHPRSPETEEQAALVRNWGKASTRDRL